MLSHEQVELIKAIDKQPTNVIQSAMNEKGDTYASLILYLLQNLSRPDTIQYVCLMTDDILSGIYLFFILLLKYYRYSLYVFFILNNS